MIERTGDEMSRTKPKPAEAKPMVVQAEKDETQAQTMARVMGVDVTLRHEGRTEEYIQFHTIDRTMRDRFGFEAGTPFEAGVRRLHRFLLEERDGAGQPA